MFKRVAVFILASVARRLMAVIMQEKIKQRKELRMNRFFDKAMRLSQDAGFMNFQNQLTLDPRVVRT